MSSSHDRDYFFFFNRAWKVCVCLCALHWCILKSWFYSLHYWLYLRSQCHECE